MTTIQLPDGSTRDFNGPVTPAQVAESIGPGLAQSAIGARVDGELVDLHFTIEQDAQISIITARKGESESSDDALWLIRHSAAHVMAEAIERLWPEVQLVYGPPVDGGFYYDMWLPDGQRISSDDFERIEQEMKSIIDEKRPFTRYEMPTEQGIEKVESEGSKYKIDNARRAIEAGSDSLSWYATGEPGKNWEDLCRGPHVPTTGRIGAFKVMNIAASYWHGDSKSDNLTRVYGTAFTDKKQLKKHLNQLEEARKRDHRVIGKQLRLFTIDEAVGQGLILWKPAGSIIRQELQNFISKHTYRQGYDQVFTPHIGRLELYRTSGHFPYYQDSQYPPIIERDQMSVMAAEGCSCGDLSNRLETGEVEGYLLKPMNCPHHIRIYASEQRSYRDLPVRLAEFGTVYRHEQSGELSGMLRVRGFTQDDGHLFCTPDQIKDEIQGCLELVKIIFETLGIDQYRVRVGLRDPQSDKYVGEASNWELAEAACVEAAELLGVPFESEEGEAAFYGPKIDFVVRDAIGRDWQLGTVQVDYNLPERFKLTYIGADNTSHRPVMIHRAPFGSMERFIGFLIEHYAGAFPAWLSPEQIRVLPVSNKTAEYAKKVQAELRANDLRAGLDSSDERLNAKVRSAAELKIPYVVVVGPRDEENQTVSVRAHGIEKDLGAVALEDFVQAISSEVADRGHGTAKTTLFPDS
ncbi:MAG: threonine--tRNA ligase [Phycisphaerales bacterium]|nr:threonine--tRNA ligase [Phycisphaerales bacterium]|tara:strand:- start:21963 stop:24038 length:2076 start_codon:yes stop_codon:yes gene_type:complete